MNTHQEHRCELTAAATRATVSSCASKETNCRLAAAAAASAQADLSVDDMDLRAVVVVDARKLQANVAASNHSQLLGQAG